MKNEGWERINRLWLPPVAVKTGRLKSIYLNII